ncbi:MAG: branched-chain amino acid transferase [Rhodospirillaceae bacterium]|jgi:branched-chain amino acid aminotransferase|nr:branched-chain amino acid transferase [Rhodospirillaceae bacterium]
MQPAFPPGIAYIDGNYVPMSEAKISVLDWGFLRSDATYDVVHVWQGRFFRLDKHIERFEASIEKLRMQLPFERTRLEEILSECVRRAELDDAYVEMVLTRGVSPTFSRDPRDAIPTFIAFAIPFGWVANEDQRRRGIDLHLADVQRIPPSAVDPTVKNYHWLDLVTGLYQAYDAGAENVLLQDNAGNVAEGPGFNLFAVKDGRVTTPASGVLHGITRATALELLAEMGISAHAAPLPIDALLQADEAFITSTAGGIMAVRAVDAHTFPAGAPGAVTERLTALYWDKHQDPDWTTSVG